MTKAFAYFECRPVLQEGDGETCRSFTDEGDFQRARTALRKEDKAVDQFWSIYGVDQDGEAAAIGDYLNKAAAHEIMNAILAPLAAAREILDAGSIHNAKGDDMRERIIDASELLDDFINQCSNLERI